MYHSYWCAMPFINHFWAMMRAPPRSRANSNTTKHNLEFEFAPAGVAWMHLDRIAIIIISLELNFH